MSMGRLLLLINKLVDNAFLHYKNKEWQKSIDCLNELIEFYHDVKLVMGGDWSLDFQENLSIAYSKLANAQNNLGLTKDAIISCKCAMSEFRVLRKAIANMTHPNLDFILARNYYQIGNSLHKTGLVNNAIVYYKLSIMLRTKLLAVQSNERRVLERSNIAKIYTNIALAQRDEFKVEAALKSYNACINILESNYLDCQTKYSDQLVMAYFNLGVAQEYFGFTSEAIATYSLAIDSSKNMQIKAGVELTQESKETLASIYFNIAEIRYNSFDLEAAISGYQLTLKLNEDHQKNGQSQFKNKLAYIYFNLGNAQGSLGYTDESIASYLSAIDLWMECFSPAIDDSNKINSNIANAFSNLAIIQKKSGDLKSAIIAYQKAIVFFERMTEYPDFSWLDECATCLANIYSNLGYLQTQQELVNEAISSYESSICLREKIIAELHKQSFEHAVEDMECMLMADYANLGLNQFTAHIKKIAEKSFQTAISLADSLRKKMGHSWDYETQYILVCVYSNLGVLQGEKGQTEPAMISFESAINLMKEHSRLFRYSSPNIHSYHLAKVYYMYGNNQVLQNLSDSAMDSYQTAIDLMECFRDKYESEWSYEYQLVLAGIYSSLGMLREKSGDIHVGLKALQNSINLITDKKYNSEKSAMAREYHHNLAIAYANIGYISIRAMMNKEAIDNFSQAFLHSDLHRLNSDKCWISHYQVNYFKILRAYVMLVKQLPAELDLSVVLNIIITYLELYPSSTAEATKLLFSLLRTYLTQSQFTAALQVLSVLQGRELFNRLQQIQHESVDSPELYAYFDTQNTFKQAIQEYAQIQNEEVRAAKESEIEKFRQAFLQARAALAELPAFKFTLTPFDLIISDLQQDLMLGSARLIWLDLPSEDLSPSIQGVLAIPSSGTDDIIWVDLRDSDIKPALTLLTYLFVTPDSDARFSSSASVDDFEVSSYCQHHQQALGLSDDEIQQLHKCNEDDANTLESILDKVWLHTKALQTKLWQESALSDWLTRLNVRAILHLTHGQAHNQPLTLGSDPSLTHHVLPNLSLFRLRQHQFSTPSNIFTTNSQVQIITDPGDDGELQQIPFVALEAEMLIKSLPEPSEIGIVSPTRSMTFDNQFPEHKTPLALLHISCHGERQVDGLTKLLLSKHEISAINLWKIKAENEINLTLINACTGGVVFDNREGDPQGLVVPLLARSKNVITTLLPVNDIVATVFSALFYHNLNSNLTVEQSFLNTKQLIITGDIPEEIIDTMVVVMRPIFELAKLGRNLLMSELNSFEATEDTYLLHCLAAIVPDVQEAVKISSQKGILLAEYLETEFRERMRLTNMPRVVREIAMAGYQLYG